MPRNNACRFCHAIVQRRAVRINILDPAGSDFPVSQ
jgi:hypothetical protein